MKARSMKAFFKDLGIGQLFCRPHTPDDNAEMESFFATLKCDRLYRGTYEDAFLAEADIADFIASASWQRLGKELAETIENHEQTPALQGGVNGDVSRGQNHSIILPVVVS